MFQPGKTVRLQSLTVALVTFLIAGTALAQRTDPCLSKPTQAEINACEAERYKKADAELNQVYRQLLTKYAAHRELIKKLKLAQEAWIKFRDADVGSLYYHNDKLGTYGSAYPMCEAIDLTRLTLQRTKELRQMLNPGEGDVCGFVAADVASPLAAPRARRSCVGGQTAPGSD